MHDRYVKILKWFSAKHIMLGDNELFTVLSHMMPKQQVVLNIINIEVLIEDLTDEIKAWCFKVKLELIIQHRIIVFLILFLFTTKRTSK